METKVEVKINSDAYSKDVILRTIEILSNRFYCELDNDGRHFIVKVGEKFLSGISAEDLSSIFFDHLNNQLIRKTISEETKDVRNFIVGKALFETEAFDEQSNYFDMGKYDDKDNYILDPNNIAHN